MGTKGVKESTLLQLSMMKEEICDGNVYINTLVKLKLRSATDLTHNTNKTAAWKTLCRPNVQVEN